MCTDCHISAYELDFMTVITTSVRLGHRLIFICQTHTCVSNLWTGPAH